MFITMSVMKLLPSNKDMFTIFVKGKKEAENTPLKLLKLPLFSLINETFTQHVRTQTQLENPNQPTRTMKIFD